MTKTYHKNGFLKSEIIENEDGSTTEKQYFENGNLKSVTQTSDDKTTTQKYDGSGEPVALWKHSIDVGLVGLMLYYQPFLEMIFGASTYVVMGFVATFIFYFRTGHKILASFKTAYRGKKGHFSRNAIYVFLALIPFSIIESLGGMNGSIGFALLVFCYVYLAYFALLIPVYIAGFFSRLVR